MPITTGAALVFTDGSSSSTAAYSIDGHAFHFSTAHPSAQLVELTALIKVFGALPMVPFNSYTDSFYIACSVPLLETAPYIRPSTNAAPLFSNLQRLILARSHPFYIGHIRAHSGLPGPLAQGNALVNQATQVVGAVQTAVPDTADPVLKAQQAHGLHHLNAHTLRHKFAITREQARQSVHQCKGCLTFLPEVHLGVNTWSYLIPFRS